jgi:hypothetical protein
MPERSRAQASRSGGYLGSSNVIPAKAGIHPSAFEKVDKWIPAFAGTTI